MASRTVDFEKSSEKGLNTVGINETTSDEETQVSTLLHVPSSLQKLNTRIESLAGFEARGITRVLPEERQQPSLASDIQVAILWFSANVSVNNLAAGLFGPLVFNLGFLDSALCATFGGLVGCASTGYMSIWGPVSGNRTMVRFCETSISLRSGISPARNSTNYRDLGRNEIFYGLLAFENPVLSKHCVDGWILHN